MSYKLNPSMIIRIFDENANAILLVSKALHKSKHWPHVPPYSTVTDEQQYEYALRARELLRELVLLGTCEKVNE